MQIPPDLPRLLAEEGARRLALARLDEAAAARDRLDSSDIEPLHDYRVALRRLRTTLRSYRRQLRSTLTRKTARRLRRLARSTRDSRDLDVHLAWLGEQRDRLGQDERPGIDWLIERLEDTRERTRGRMLRRDAGRFPQVTDRLTAELTKFRTTIRLDASFRRHSMAAVTAARAGRAARLLRDRLGVVHDYSEAIPLHQARIAAKHLRYLLEPFAERAALGHEVIDRLKSLQDALGDVHDAHVFRPVLAGALADAMQRRTASGSPVPGVRAVRAALDRRGREAFEAVRGAWLAGAAEPFFRQVDAVRETIAALATEGEEVERKFLLTGLPPLEGSETTVVIEQLLRPTSSRVCGR